MKTILTFLIVLCCFVMTTEAKVIITDNLIDSICQVESGNNPNAVGDNGKSIGIAQIQKVCVDDVNRILKLQTKKGVKPKTFSYDDRKSVSKSKEIMRIYLEYYGKRYFKLTGMNPSAQVLSRIWNGGPNGWQMKATYAYMQRVNKYLVA